MGKNRFRIKKNDEFLYPGDRDQIYLWIKKWRITDAQLNEAIIETGSVHTSVLREYFIRKGQLFSIRNFINKIAGRME